GQVVAAPGFGTLEGTVLKADGTPLENPAEVVVNIAGARIVTTSGPDGTFMAELVPEGSFRVSVFEPATARTGEAFGRIERDLTTNVTVSLVGLGAVSGVVYSNDGLETITGALVTLFPSGSFTAPLVTQADIGGSYGLPGVPLGPYSVQVLDNFTGLRGSNTGVMQNDGDELSTDVYLDPSASITGTVYAAGTVLDGNGAAFEPDGVTPCTGQCAVATADVSIQGREARTLQSGPDGRFDSGLYLPLGTYTITARIPGQGTRQSVALTFDGEAPELALVLEGLGTVEGVVLDSTGTEPVDLAQVTLQSRSPYSSGEQSAQTDATGRFSFSDVAVGTVVVSARKTVQGVPLGGAITRSLTQNGQILALEGADALVLEESAQLVGRVVFPDGETPAPGTVVSVDNAEETAVSVVAGSDGRFDLLALPLDAYALQAREASSNAIARLDVTLDVNGETRDLGDLVLDATAPSVVSIAPEDGATNVAPATTVEVVFSEAIVPSTVGPGTLPIRVGGTTVAGTYELTTVDGRSTVSFTPAELLPDLSSVTVIVRPEVRGFDGELTSIGVTDAAGFGLEREVRASFATADTTAAEVVSLSPADNALEVPPDAVVRVEFNEAIAPESFGGISLSRDGVPVSGSTSFAFDDRVVIFAPTDPLLPN
ncbi:MAG: Ig-like domain-containing protein, partial [Myxococcota bacterium]